MKLREFISEIEKQSGTSITDPSLLEFDMLMINMEPTSRPEVIVLPAGVAGPTIYLTAPRGL